MSKHTAQVKHLVVDAAVKMMLRVGCEVTETRDEYGITLGIVIPPDSADRHGANLLAMVDAQKSGTGSTDPA